MNGLTSIQLLLLVVTMVMGQMTTPSPLTSPACASNGKATPSEEKNLHQCKQYSCQSCCSEDITKELALMPLERVGNLSYKQCNHTLSHACSTEITFLECFYRCSPNLFPWIRPITKTLSKIPLCAKFCDRWYDTCMTDQTCVVGDNGNWISGLNHGLDEDGNPKNPCKGGSTCRTYKEVYENGKNLCDNIWGNLFYYSNDDKNCMNPSDPEGNSVVIENLDSNYVVSHCAKDQVPYTDVGLIVGVVFGVLAAVFLIVAGVLYYMRKKKGKDVESTNPKPKPKEQAPPEEMTTLRTEKPDTPPNSARDSDDEA